jgi:dipeptidyl aminopeptidase/acylaminoacyl peptidase
MKRLLLAAIVVICAASSVRAASPIVERHAVVVSAEMDRETATLLGTISVERITYLSDGLRINAYLAMPTGGGPFPAVISNRGGNFTLSVWTDAAAVQVLGRWASWGYVAAASQYRGAGDSEGHDDYGGADVDDVLNLLPVLDALPQVDRARIGMTGASRGGMMTYLALTQTDRIRAAIVVSGLSDLFENGRARPEMESNFKRFMPDYAADREEALRKRSAIRWVDRIPKNVPILVEHGTADWRVSVSQGFEMAHALAESKHPVRLIVYEGGSHGVPEFAAERFAAERAWFDKYVRDGKAWPDLKPHGQ